MILCQRHFAEPQTGYWNVAHSVCKTTHLFSGTSCSEKPLRLLHCLFFSFRLFYHFQIKEVLMPYFWFKAAVKSSSECKRKNVQCYYVGFLQHPVGGKASTLPFSVMSTFTTNRLKPPLDIQLFTSDKPPSSAPLATGAIVTSTRVNFHVFHGWSNPINPRTLSDTQLCFPLYAAAGFPFSNSWKPIHSYTIEIELLLLLAVIHYTVQQSHMFTFTVCTERNPQKERRMIKCVDFDESHIHTVCIMLSNSSVCE